MSGGRVESLETPRGDIRGKHSLVKFVQVRVCVRQVDIDVLLVPAGTSEREV